MKTLFDAEWLHDDGENLSAYDKAKAIWARAERQLADKDNVIGVLRELREIDAK